MPITPASYKCVCDRCGEELRGRSFSYNNYMVSDDWDTAVEALFYAVVDGWAHNDFEIYCQECVSNVRK